MITYEITEFAILSIFSKCASKITINELFDLLPEKGLPQEGAVTFIKTLNQLLDMELVETITQNSDGHVYWKISVAGRQYMNDFLR